MSDPQTAREIALRVRAGELTAEAVVEERLQRIDAGRALGAVLHVDRERALARARAIDLRRRRGEPLGALAGVPVGVKDNICTRGIPTTCGSRMLEGWRPPYDATAVHRLERSDAIVLCKTSCDEFGMGSSTETCAFGPARHPRDPGRVPGGSSGGSAAAVAAGQLPAALGSDTGGSVRQPAALCGLVGFKPTYGRVSRYGLVAYASSMDQIGPLTRNVDDAELLTRAMAGVDRHDATSLDAPWSDTGAGRADAAVRVGVLEDFLEAPELHPAAGEAVESARRELSRRGHRTAPARLPGARQAIAAYHVIASAEASSNLARFDGVRFGRRVDTREDVAGMYAATRGEAFGTEVKRRILLGTFALSSGYREAYYLRARAARDHLSTDLDGLWRSFDVLLGPTVPQPAFALGEKLDDPVAMLRSDLFTVVANLTGVPALSLPASEPVDFPRADDGPGAAPARVHLPLGVQLLAPRQGEATLLSVARSLEAAGFAFEG